MSETDWRLTLAITLVVALLIAAAIYVKQRWVR